MDSYSIVITSKAQSDLSECVSFVLNISKEAAISLAKSTYNSVESLSAFPERNPVFDMPKPFPFVVRKHIVDKRYAVLYTIENSQVVVYRIIDSRRQFNYLV